ncbi:hypothetical protein [Ruegeria arenilitoris]|uniref:hypothetical protein n=1 Tax=Ruegeria arenilitoris TaxID=1173585 RepID=UPI001480296F|nr:hypothetical protein [Ruegeria arenilitoris]
MPISLGGFIYTTISCSLDLVFLKSKYHFISLSFIPFLFFLHPWLRRTLYSTCCWQLFSLFFLIATFGKRVETAENRFLWIFNRISIGEPKLVRALSILLVAVSGLAIAEATLALSRKSAEAAYLSKLNEPGAFLLFEGSFRNSVSNGYNDNSEVQFHRFLNADNLQSRNEFKVVSVFSDKKNHFLFLVMKNKLTDGLGVSVPRGKVTIMARGFHS